MAPGHGYVEVTINKEDYLKPHKNLHRWNWQFRFAEINGVGVTLNKCWERGYRGSEEQVNRKTAVHVRIKPFGTAFLDKPFMQFSTNFDKSSPGTMKFIYSGVDDNGHKLKTKVLEITRPPHK